MRTNDEGDCEDRDGGSQYIDSLLIKYGEDDDGHLALRPFGNPDHLRSLGIASLADAAINDRFGGIDRDATAYQCDYAYAYGYGDSEGDDGDDDNISGFHVGSEGVTLIQAQTVVWGARASAYRYKCTEQYRESESCSNLSQPYPRT